MKSIDTLVEDIYAVMHPDSHTHIYREELVHTLNDIGRALTQPLEKDEGRQYYVRPSNLGKGLRWHYFSKKFPQLSEKFDGKQIMLFQAGHVQEAILLMYARLAGHSVTHQQAKVSLGELSGSCDCVIDGYLIDVKTTSDYSYKKFEQGNISLDNDPFGYIAQLSTYKQGLVAAGEKIKGQGWLVYNKNNSKMCLHLIPDEELIDATAKHEAILKAYKAKKMPKELCKGAEPTEDTSGNKKMSFLCEYCPFKEKCWPDYRVFRYANKDTYFTEIKKQPRVQEVTGEYR